MAQQYFLSVITDKNEYKVIQKLPKIELSSLKVIDKYTSRNTYEDIVNEIEKSYNIKVKEVRVKHVKENNRSDYYGIVTNNLDYNKCIDELKKVKIGEKRYEKVPLNNNLFNFEFNSFLMEINNNLILIEELYGIKNSLYSKARNYVDSIKHDGSIHTQRELEYVLKDEFSKFSNFRIWMTRDTKVIKEYDDSKDANRQLELIYDWSAMDVSDYENKKQEKRQKEEPQKPKENKQQYSYNYDKHLSDKEKEDVISKYNREHDEYLEPNDFIVEPKELGIEDNDLGSWKVNTKTR